MDTVYYDGELAREFKKYRTSNPFLHKWFKDNGIEAETLYINRGTKRETYSYPSSAELRLIADQFRDTEKK